MKQERKSLSWNVKYFNSNAQRIETYDILKYREDYIKRLKKESKTKEAFAHDLKSEMMYRFWSRAEWELIIEIDDDNRIWLIPWVGCSDPDKVKIDVTDDTSFEWRNFAEQHIKKQIYKNRAKVDIYNQLEYKWNEFVTYCWEYQHKWQRTKR